MTRPVTGEPSFFRATGTTMRLVGRGRDDVPLPAADERDVSLGVRRRLAVARD